MLRRQASTFVAQSSTFVGFALFAAWRSAHAYIYSMFWQSRTSMFLKHTCVVKGRWGRRDRNALGLSSPSGTAERVFIWSLGPRLLGPFGSLNSGLSIYKGLGAVGMATCPECYDPACAKSSNPNAACNCSDFIQVARNINNTYSNSVYQALPPSASSITPSHLDALRNYSNPMTIGTLSTAADTLYNNGQNLAAAVPGVAAVGDPWYQIVDATDFNNLYLLLEIYKHRGNARGEIRSHLEKLSFTASQAGQREMCNRALERTKDFDKALLDSGTPKVSSADDFDNRKFPLARLYFLITKYAESGSLTMAQSSLTSGRLDEATGKPVLIFEKLKPISSINNLHLVWRDFEASVYVVGMNGGRVAWKPLWDILYGLCRSKNDPQYLHELLFEILSYIDLNQNINVVTFVSQHWQTFLITFEAKWGENGPPGEGDPSSSGYGHDQSGITKSREHVKFGDVTKQGEWSGEMRTRSGAIAFCNKWNQGKPCNRGVFTGKHKGKCAYTHKCRWCMSSAHRGEEKHPTGHTDAGKWVCPKHP